MADEIRRKREVLKGKLKKVAERMMAIFANRSTLDIENLSKLEEVLGDYNKMFSSLDGFTDQLLEAYVVAEVDDYADKEQTILDELERYRDVKNTTAGKIKNFHRLLAGEHSRQSLLPSSGNSSLNQTMYPSPVTPKLEKIAIPEFNGEILNFTNFRNLFEDLVHSRDDLTSVQKLYYLKQACTGKAAEMIRDYPTTGDAYPEVWSFLLKRFHNPRAVVRSWFNKLRSLEPIKNDSKVRELLDNVEIIIRGLRSAGEIISDTFSRYVAFHVSMLLDFKTQKDWENSLSNNDSYPKFSELRVFLNNRAFATEVIYSKTGKSVSEKRIALNTTCSESSRNQDSTLGTERKSQNCVLCNESHQLVSCSSFLSKSIADRFAFVKTNRLCTNCLKPNHAVRDCKTVGCSKCSRKHNSLLHREVVQTVNNAEKTEVSSGADKSSVNFAYSGIVKASRIRLLPTAIVHVIIGDKRIKARALLDSCSEAHLISENFVRKHRLRVSSSSSLISGVTAHEVRSSKCVSLTVKSVINDFKLEFVADVIVKIPYTVGHQKFAEVRNCYNLEGYQLADFDTESAEVDILIGVELANRCLSSSRRFLGELCLQSSQFGWIVSGVIPSEGTPSPKFCSLVADIKDELKRFWEVEEIEICKDEDTTAKHEMIEKHFSETVRRLEDGRFQVSLPFSANKESLADTYQQARRSLLRCEKLSSEVRLMYSDFMEEYLRLNHMEKALPRSNNLLSKYYYLPHHAVLKLTSSTTPLRVVFNASAHNASGLSLNDVLMTGPKLQPDLFDILVKFRTYVVAFVADISKMYRCIAIAPEDRDYQRILWRQNPNEPIREYRLTTVTYGTSPASYLATRCLKEIVKEIRQTEPEVAHSIEHEFYMDDLMTGSKTVAEAARKQRLIHDLLSSARLPLRKYASNSRELLERIESGLVEEGRTLNFESQGILSILGINWNPTLDKFAVRIELPPDVCTANTLTKRKLSSVIAKTFDPLGLVSPITIVGKLLLQQVWREEIGWDDLVSEKVRVRFADYVRDLRLLENFQIPRVYSLIEAEDQLIGFCDASESAYSAVVYLRRSNNKGTSAVIVAGKTRVAPIKEITIPRLELLGAVSLVKLILRISSNLMIKTENIYCFCDSTIALSWIKGPSSKYETFVRNRSAFINLKLPFNHWRYVKSSENPADLCTRGISAESLIDRRLFWLHGPVWLNDEFDDHLSPSTPVHETTLERRKFTALSITESPQLLKRFSSYVRCLRVVAYMLRFRNRCQKFKVPETLYLSVRELKNAFNWLILVTQKEFFAKEIETLQRNQVLSGKSTLSSLSAFLDSEGVLRVGGRLSNSNLSSDRKHPVIIHRKSWLLRLYIDYIHKSYAHATSSFCINIIRGKFWVMGGLARMIKGYINRCVKCARIRAQTSTQLMGQLPAPRVNCSRPFTHTGVDLTGFFKIKCVNHRATKFYKAYVVVFICLAVKAVHLEMVSDLSTDTFVAAFDRFASRRGLPAVVYSDNATNFVGVQNIIEINHNKVAEDLATRGIQWSFIVPQSPHRGGLWEAAVKSCKSVLKRIIGEQILTFEEMQTVIVKVEGILNSRPLCLSNDPCIPALTPAHFIMGTELFDVPEREERSVSYGRRYRLLRTIVSSFWKRWLAEYLPKLQTRTKWKSLEDNFKVGDIVLLLKYHTPVLQWPLGKVVATHSDSVGVVRSAEVKTNQGVFTRSVQHLVRLPVSSWEEDVGPSSNR